MTKLDFKLANDKASVREGATVNITDAWCDMAEQETFLLDLYEPDSKLAMTVRVYGNVVVGGKNYLMFKDLERQNDCMLVARFFDSKRLGAMDKDRFSSLRNAFALSLENNLLMTKQELELVLGPLPSR